MTCGSKSCNFAPFVEEISKFVVGKILEASMQYIGCQEYHEMGACFRQYRDAMFEVAELREASEFHEILLAFCAIYEPAARVGEFVTGQSWNPRRVLLCFEYPLLSPDTVELGETELGRFSLSFSAGSSKIKILNSLASKAS
jgi:hypothetical protein